MISRAYPAVPISGLAASLLILLLGAVADLGPPPPAGELLRGTVMSVQPASDGQPVTALLQIDTEGGPVFCGIDLTALAGQRLPAPHTELTVDYQPTGCALPPVSQQLPRGVILGLGGVGALLMGLWLWAGR
jgi:hypothetical protein